MLPVKLTLEGIYSYRERQTIDFTRLTEARLFGIFGPVGSGKSTILEAMIYAIYGTIDRLNNDVKYNVITRNPTACSWTSSSGRERTGDCTGRRWSAGETRRGSLR